MTDEEISKLFATGYATKELNPILRAHLYECAKESFLAGLKAGSQLDKVWHDYDAGEDCYEDSHESKWVKRETSKPKWHNLRENRNDLPPLWEGCERSSIRCVDEYDRIIFYDYGSERWRDCEGDHLGVQPDFWCEIPQYTEE